MAGYFQLKSNASDKFVFNLKSGNHEVVLTSELYASIQSALNGIEAVRSHAAQAERFQRKVAKDSSLYFVLRASNGQIIGKSQMYSTASAMENGIKSVMATGTSTLVRGLNGNE